MYFAELNLVVVVVTVAASHSSDLVLHLLLPVVHAQLTPRARQIECTYMIVLIVYTIIIHCTILHITMLSTLTMSSPAD